MGVRSTVYNAGLVTPEKWEKVNAKNKELMEYFITSLDAAGKSDQTIKQYTAQLKIVMVYISEFCGNKEFVDLKKRDLIQFEGWLQNTLKVSGKRISSFKSVISSFSNYIMRAWDDEYPNFKNISSIIEVTSSDPVREKTVLSEEQIMTCVKSLSTKKPQVACFMALLFASGMRKAEAIQMTVDDFKESNKVMNGIFYLTRKIRTKGRGKQGKILQKYVFCDIFEPYFKIWMEEREKKGINSPWLFVTYRDGNYEQAQVSTANSFAETIGRELDMPIYCHSFRHGWCTYLHRKGYPETVIQKLQGWAGLDMVSLYNDISDEEELQDFFSKFQAPNKED